MTQENRKKSTFMSVVNNNEHCDISESDDVDKINATVNEECLSNDRCIDGSQEKESPIEIKEEEVKKPLKAKKEKRKGSGFVTGLFKLTKVASIISVSVGLSLSAPLILPIESFEDSLLVRVEDAKKEIESRLNKNEMNNSELINKVDLAIKNVLKESSKMNTELEKNINNQLKEVNEKITTINNEIDNVKKLIKESDGSENEALLDKINKSERTVFILSKEIKVHETKIRKLMAEKNIINNANFKSKSDNELNKEPQFIKVERIGYFILEDVIPFGQSNIALISDGLSGSKQISVGQVIASRFKVTNITRTSIQFSDSVTRKVYETFKK